MRSNKAVYCNPKTYKELTVNKTEFGMSITFQAEDLPVNEDGDEAGATITIFFTKRRRIFGA